MRAGGTERAGKRNVIGTDARPVGKRKPAARYTANAPGPTRKYLVSLPICVRFSFRLPASRCRVDL